MNNTINSLFGNNNTSNINNNSHQQLQNSEQNIVVERHYIPLSIYRELYFPPNTVQNTTSIQHSTIDRLNRRSNRMNIDYNTLYQNLANLVYGTYNSSNLTQTNSTSPLNNLSTNTTTNTTQNNTTTNGQSTPLTNSGTLYFRMIDVDGNEYSYNTSTNTSNNDNFFTRLMNPNIPLSEVFNSTRLLTEEEIANNTNISTIEEDNNEMCSICQENFQVGDETREIDNCNHEFHRNCIDEWFRTRITCPVCRGNVLSNE